MDLDCHLSEIARGDTVAFTHWVAAAELPVRVSLQRFAARVDVEVVVQETLLRIWQVAPRVVPDGRQNSLLRLAVRTAHNLAIDELRRSRRFVHDGGDPSLLSGVSDVEAQRVEPIEVDPKLRENIVRCHAQLPDKPARALLARVDSAGSESDEQLATTLEMRLNTFHQNLARARKLLAECLRRAGIDWQGGATT